MDNNIQTENQQENEENKAPEVNETAEQPAKKPFPKWIIAAACAAVAVIISAVVIFMPKHDNYTVRVVDEVGNPVSSVMVTITDKKGEQKTKMTDDNGLAIFNDVLVGNNSVTLDVAHREIMNLSKITLINNTYSLERKTRDLCAVVRDETKIHEIYGEVPDGEIAYTVGVGSYSLSVLADDRAYVVFYAQSKGVYKVSIKSNNPEATVGFYGIPMFVQADHRADGEYDGKSFELIIQDSATPYVIGVSSPDAAEISLKIERTGDAPFDPNFVEWTEVAVDDSKLVDCNLGGKTLIDVDITKKSLDITVDDDGYYYINGKRAYIRITTPTSYGYYTEDLQFAPVLNGSLALLAGHVDPKVGVNIGGWVYDENGNFVAKYRYNDLIGRYMEHVDGEYGVIPLDEQLAECIKLQGENGGWFDPEKPGYLFGELDKQVNDDISWLFLCMVEV